jgi:nicotinamidase-related amidase
MEDNNELKGLLDPKHTALVVWDVQKAVVNSIFNKEEFLEANRKILSKARERGISVFFSKITPLPERFESPARKYFAKRRGKAFSFTPDGLELALETTPTDIILPKNTASIFVGTNFELYLRNAGLTTILFTGIATEMGVESSARDASNRGFFPVVLSDAVSSFNQEGHNRSLENLKSILAVLPSSELFAFWD